MQTISVTDRVYNMLADVLAGIQNECRATRNCTIDDLAHVILLSACEMYEEENE